MDPNGPPFSERNPERDIHNLIQKVIEITPHTFSQDDNISEYKAPQHLIYFSVFFR